MLTSMGTGDHQQRSQRDRLFQTVDQVGSLVAEVLAQLKSGLDQDRQLASPIARCQAIAARVERVIRDNPHLQPKQRLQIGNRAATSIVSVERDSRHKVQDAYRQALDRILAVSGIYEHHRLGVIACLSPTGYPVFVEQPEQPAPESPDNPASAVDRAGSPAVSLTEPADEEAAQDQAYPEVLHDPNMTCLAHALREQTSYRLWLRFRTTIVVIMSAGNGSPGVKRMPFWHIMACAVDAPS